MKVILQRDVPNLGDAGEVKEVAAGFARNYLIPRKLVVAAIGGSAKAAEHQKQLMEIRAAKRHKDMEDVASRLQALGTLEIPVRVGAKGKLFGSVTALSIAQNLSEAGFPVDKRKVELSETIKATGTYQVKVKLAEKLSATISLNIVPDEESLRTLKQEEEEEAARNARDAALERAKAGLPPLEVAKKAEEAVEEEALEAEAAEAEEAEA